MSKPQIWSKSYSTKYMDGTESKEFTIEAMNANGDHTYLRFAEKERSACVKQLEELLKTIQKA